MRAGKDHFKEEKGGAHDLSPEQAAAENAEAVEGAAEAAMDEDQKKVPEYTTYPREFITYKWYRPIIVLILGFIALVVMEVIMMQVMQAYMPDKMGDLLEMMRGGYDELDVYTGPGALLSLGNIVLLIPSLAIANKLAGRRTFKSYESSRGNGWDFGIFFKCLLVALIVVSLPIVVDYLFIADVKDPVSKFTTSGLIVLTLLGPAQCIAEEYVFRAFGMQAVGSWFKSPILAIILPTIAFTAMHPYDIYGMASVAISGLLFGVNAWLGRGIEVSSALHICNNMAVFYMTGFGYGAISSESDITAVIFSLITYGVYTVVMIIFRKRGMFDKRKGNDAAKYNAKAQKKIDKKEAKRAAKEERKASKH